MPTLADDDSRKKLNQRLSRIAGQLRGLQTMLDDQRDCQEVLQQFSAIRAALQSANLFYFQQVAENCLNGLQKDTASPEGTINTLLKMMDKITQP